jgi:hypothetical protein
MTAARIKVGSVVKNSRPTEGEADLRFILKEDNGNRVLIELICDYRIKPLETVAEDEIEPA